MFVIGVDITPNVLLNGDIFFPSIEFLNNLSPSISKYAIISFSKRFLVISKFFSKFIFSDIELPSTSVGSGGNSLFWLGFKSGLD